MSFESSGLPRQENHLSRRWFQVSWGVFGIPQ